jgi:hypothetical protein
MINNGQRPLIKQITATHLQPEVAEPVEAKAGTNLWFPVFHAYSVIGKSWNPFFSDVSGFQPDWKINLGWRLKQALPRIDVGC